MNCGLPQARSDKVVTTMQLKRREFLRYLAGVTAGSLLAGCPTLRPSERLNFVLVHGGWHGAWCWDKLSPLLRAQGHQVTAVDLPGHGADRTPVDQISLESYVKCVIDVLDAQSTPAVLVGHSIGGMTISQVGEERPEKIRTLVYLTAFLMANGETASSRRDPDSKLAPLVLVEFRPGTQIPLQSRLDVSKPDAVKLALYNDCKENDVRAAIARLGPEPMTPSLEKLRLSPERFGRVDKVYIFCSKDNVTTPNRQRNHAAKWPIRKGITLDASHSPFMSMPSRLAQALTSELYV
jgi:pimeloyl-ACP methyl ester carboxylesterase